MTIKLTDAQAEVIEELNSTGYGQLSFLPHTLFRARDNRDNGMRRTLRGLIAKGVLVPDGTVDAYRNPFYKFGPDVYELYQDWLRRKDA